MKENFVSVLPVDKTSVFSNFLALYKAAALCYTPDTAYPIGSYLYPTTLFGGPFFGPPLFYAIPTLLGICLNYGRPCGILLMEVKNAIIPYTRTS